MKKRESDCKEQRYIRPEKRKRRIVVAVILIVVIVGLTLLYMAGCPRFYSDEMHQRRISRKFQKEYVDTGIYTDFKVYPLYDIDDNIIRYLIETEPANHFYVRTQPNYFFIHESLSLKNCTIKIQSLLIIKPQVVIIIKLMNGLILIVC